jgi:hypothetical protein
MNTLYKLETKLLGIYVSESVKLDVYVRYPSSKLSKYPA